MVDDAGPSFSGTSDMDPDEPDQSDRRYGRKYLLPS